MVMKKEHAFFICGEDWYTYITVSTSFTILFCSWAHTQHRCTYLQLVPRLPLCRGGAWVRGYVPPCLNSTLFEHKSYQIRNDIVQVWSGNSFSFSGSNIRVDKILFQCRNWQELREKWSCFPLASEPGPWSGCILIHSCRCSACAIPSHASQQYEESAAFFKSYKTICHKTSIQESYKNDTRDLGRLHKILSQDSHNFSYKKLSLCNCPKSLVRNCN